MHDFERKLPGTPRNSPELTSLPRTPPNSPELTSLGLRLGTQVALTSQNARLRCFYVLLLLRGMCPTYKPRCSAKNHDADKKPHSRANIHAGDPKNATLCRRERLAPPFAAAERLPGRGARWPPPPQPPALCCRGAIGPRDFCRRGALAPPPGPGLCGRGAAGHLLCCRCPSSPLSASPRLCQRRVALSAVAAALCRLPPFAAAERLVPQPLPQRSAGSSLSPPSLPSLAISLPLASPHLLSLSLSLSLSPHL